MNQLSRQFMKFPELLEILSPKTPNPRVGGVRKRFIVWVKLIKYISIVLHTTMTIAVALLTNVFLHFLIYL